MAGQIGIPRVLGLAAALLVLAAAERGAAEDYLLTASGSFDSSYSESYAFDGTTNFEGHLPSLFDTERLEGGSFRATFRFSTMEPPASGSFAFYQFDSLAGLSYSLFDPVGAVVHVGTNPSEAFAFVWNDDPDFGDRVSLFSFVNDVSALVLPPTLYQPEPDLYAVQSALLFGDIVGNGTDFISSLALPTDAATFLSFPDKTFRTGMLYIDGDGFGFFGDPFQYVESTVQYVITGVTVTPIPEPTSLVICMVGLVFAVAVRRRKAWNAQRSLTANCGVIAVAIAIAGVGSVPAVASPTIYSLGATDGFDNSRGYSVNTLGQVAVTSVELFGEGTAYRYDGAPGPGGILRNLGALPGHQHAYAKAINSSGQVAGMSQQSHIFSPTRAFRYDGTPGAGGVMRDLGTLGGDSSAAYGINDFGQVTGYAHTDLNGPNAGSFAFIYTGTPGAGGVMHSLGALGGPGSSGIQINNAGQVVGIFQVAIGGASHAFRYDGPAGSGIMRDLAPSAGFNDSYGRGINASGQVVGDMSTANFGRGFVYTGTPGIDGVMTELSPLLGASNSLALAINDSGYVLGISDDAAGENILPVLWRPDGSIIDLEAWLNSVNPTQGADWDLKNAFVTSISNNGLITGDATYIGPGVDHGRQLAFILDASSLVPEPTNLGFLGAGVIALLRRRATHKQIRKWRYLGRSRRVYCEVE